MNNEEVQPSTIRHVNLISNLTRTRLEKEEEERV